MSNEQVSILLSTYNGEAYLAEQIKSIREQSYLNWNLFIRDDGSRDDTCLIIDRFCLKDQRIHFINKENRINCGVKKSFLKLLDSVHSEYYMFCDQDDVWLPDKVENTLAIMDKKQSHKPQLVFTDLCIVDSNLQIINQSALHEVDVNYWIDPNNSIMDNVVTGCTVMINDALKKIALPVDSNLIVMHDWWFALLASQLGQLKYLNKPTILYRQHGDNQVGINANVFAKLKKISKFQKFQNLVDLQLKQGNLSVERSKFIPNVTIGNFLAMNTDLKTIQKIKIVLKNRFKKHTKPGTLALNVALLKTHQG